MDSSSHQGVKWSIGGRSIAGSLPHDLLEDDDDFAGSLGSNPVLYGMHGSHPPHLPRQYRRGGELHTTRWDGMHHRRWKASQHLQPTSHCSTGEYKAIRVSMSRVLPDKYEAALLAGICLSKLYSPCTPLYARSRSGGEVEKIGRAHV